MWNTPDKTSRSFKNQERIWSCEDPNSLLGKGDFDKNRDLTRLWKEKGNEIVHRVNWIGYSISSEPYESIGSINTILSKYANPSALCELRIHFFAGMAIGKQGIVFHSACSFLQISGRYSLLGSIFGNTLSLRWFGTMIRLFCWFQLGINKRP